MKEKIILREATPANTERIWEIICDAKEQMRMMNSRQWQEGYPSLEDISWDVEMGYGYILCQGESVIAYAAVIFDGEPVYNNLQGKWLTDLPYVVVHRMAVAAEMRKKGMATMFMQKIEELSRQIGIKSFRVDTNFDNVYMHKILYNLDFTYCGEVFYGEEKRKAFEKRLF